MEQTEKMVQFGTSDSALGQQVYELVTGVDRFDLDLGVQISQTDTSADMYETTSFVFLIRD